MQNNRGYIISELVDKSKEIVIMNFYSNSLLFRGKYEDIPSIYLNIKMRMFTPYDSYYEFYI
jgi:hypothetical protein